MVVSGNSRQADCASSAGGRRLPIGSDGEAIRSDPTDGLPSGVDPSSPGLPNDSSLGAARAAAIAAEKKKWRDRQAKRKPKPPAEPKREDVEFDE